MDSLFTQLKEFTQSDLTIAGSNPVQILSFVGILILSYLAGKVIAWLLKRSASKFDRSRKQLVVSTLESLAKSTVLVLFVAGLCAGLKVLVMNDSVRELSNTVSGILITIAIAHLFYHLIEVPNSWLTRKAMESPDKMDDLVVPVVRKSLKVTIIVLAIVQIATVLSGKSMSSLLAGLGIGGLAIALGAQETLKNFFGSISILMDKPFRHGDRVVVDTHDGTVEDVGFRSTKIRNLDGHLVTVPNGELASKIIQNIGERPNIKRVLLLGLTYDTPPAKIRKAKEIVEELLKDHEGMSEEMPPRVFFKEFNDFNLELFVLYWYHPADFWAYLEFSENLNLEILERFNAEGIEFAFPTQTVHLENS